MAAWHINLNGGLVPILETPAGDFIRESSIISQLAVELGKDQGIEIVPSDPIAAAKMRLEIEAFKSKLPIFFAMKSSIGKDIEVIDRFGSELLADWE